MMSIMLIPIIMGIIAAFIITTCEPRRTIAKIGAVLVMCLFLWMPVSALQPSEILTKEKYQTFYENDIVGVTYNSRFYNLNEYFDLSLQKCSEVYVVEYKKNYCGLIWPMVPTFELIPKKELIHPIPSLTIAPSWSNPFEESSDEIGPLIGYDGKPVKGPE